MNAETPTFTSESVRSQFAIYAATWWIGYPLSIVAEFLPVSGRLALGFLALPVLIVATVFWCIQLYRHWSLLQGHGARMTPGEAVGFGFIPFFCFYWWFVAYAGLAVDTNAYLRKAGITSKCMSYCLAVTNCVLSILVCTIGLIPKVGAVFSVPLLLISFILALQQRDCILAILEERSGKRQPLVS